VTTAEPTPAEIHEQVQLRRAWVRQLKGRKSTLLTLADLNREYLAARDSGADQLADFHLHQIRLAVAPETAGACAATARELPRLWWQSPACLTAIGLAMFCLFLAVGAGATWLRAVDAETQLEICQRHG